MYTKTAFYKFKKKTLCSRIHKFLMLSNNQDKKENT